MERRRKEVLREMAIRDMEFQIWTLKLAQKEEKLSKTLEQINQQTNKRKKG